jgi:hypothetical protein
MLFINTISQCITGQFWKTEVAVLSDQVRLVACRNVDILDDYPWFILWKLINWSNKNKKNTANVCHLHFWSNNSALFEHWNWKSSFKHRGWYVFARRKGVKIKFFSIYTLNYVKYVLTIWWNRHRRFQCKENITVNALIFLTTRAFNIVLHSTSLYA